MPIIAGYSDSNKLKSCLVALFQDKKQDFIKYFQELDFSESEFKNKYQIIFEKIENKAVLAKKEEKKLHSVFAFCILKNRKKIQNEFNELYEAKQINIHAFQEEVNFIFKNAYGSKKLDNLHLIFFLAILVDGSGDCRAK